VWGIEIITSRFLSEILVDLVIRVRTEHQNWLVGLFGCFHGEGMFHLVGGSLVLFQGGNNQSNLAAVCIAHKNYDDASGDREFGSFCI
jgi:hypothetical protein